MIAADQIKPWGQAQYLGLAVVVVVIMLAMPSTRRLAMLVAVVGFGVLVLVQTVDPQFLRAAVNR